MKDKYDVSFILPMPTFKIVGGYKMVYEYSNYLAEHGIKVCIIYNCNNGVNSKNIPQGIAMFIRKMLTLCGPVWFELNKKIEQIAIPEFNQDFIPSSKVLIATTAQTSIFLNKYKRENVKKIYFIQGYENWDITDEKLFETYGYDMKKITVSHWLEPIINSHSLSPAVCIPNGVDGNIFKVKTNIMDRQQHTISMMYHESFLKGADIGIKVLYSLKRLFPDMNAYLFGSPKRKNTWPDWIHYKRNANPKQVSDIMNSSCVFLCTSRSEGYGLTVLEAMFCGCAIVSTRCGGISEFTNESNTIFCEVDNLDELVTETAALLATRHRIYEMSRNSQLLAKSREIRNSKEAFLKVIINELLD